MNQTPPMDEVPQDTPEFESTAAIAREGEDGSDALQVGRADAAGPVPAPADDAFAMHLGDAKPAKPVDKPSKPVTAAANRSLVAALMGQPIAKSKAKPTPAATFDDEAASDSLSRYAGGGLGRGSAEAPTPTPPPAVVTTVPAAPADWPQITPPPQPPVTVVSGVPVDVIHTPSRPTVSAVVAVPQTPSLTLPRSAGRGDQTPAPAPIPSKPAASPAKVPPRAIPVAPVWPGHPAAAPKPTPRPVAAKADEPRPAPAIPPAPAPLPTGAWWTIPLTFVGIAITACAVIIPAADENRRDTYELAKIERDVDYFQRQSAVNQDFVRRINTDATLAERLALRQLHRTREGAKVVALGGLKPDRFGASPYAMTRLDPPADLPAYRPVPGKLSEWFLGDKRPQQMAGLGLCVAGAGVLLGGLRKRRRPTSPLTA